MSTESLKLTFLGTGTSIGIPVPGCRCKVCRSRDRRNRRSRSSIIIESRTTRVLIDTTPEFRLQALSAGIDRLDAVFWTHAHADHLHGLDDLRALTWNNAIPGYASGETIAEIKHRFDYLWKSTQKGGGKAQIILNSVADNGTVHVGDLELIPIPVMHGNLQVFGWRCGPIAYITDVSHIPDKSFALLENLDILVLGALRFKSHPTHFSIEKARDAIKKIRPRRAYLTHISHEVSHIQIMRATESQIWPAHDGLSLRSPTKS